MPDSDPPRSEPLDEVPVKVRPWVAKAKGLRDIITALAALAVALSAFFKPADKKVPQAVYEELSIAIKDLSVASTKNHEDIVLLHGYLEGRDDRPVPTEAVVAPPVRTAVKPTAKSPSVSPKVKAAIKSYVEAESLYTSPSPPPVETPAEPVTTATPVVIAAEQAPTLVQRSELPPILAAPAPKPVLRSFEEVAK